jgi:hypothetical protein
MGRTCAGSVLQKEAKDTRGHHDLGRLEGRSGCDSGGLDEAGFSGRADGGGTGVHDGVGGLRVRSERRLGQAIAGGDYVDEDLLEAIEDLDGFEIASQLFMLEG